METETFANSMYFTMGLCHITHYLLEYYCMINLHEHKYLGLDDLNCLNAATGILSGRCWSAAREYNQYWCGAM